MLGVGRPLSLSQFHSLGIPWVGLDGVHVGVDHSTARRLAFKSCHHFCSRNEKDASELGDCDYTHTELSCLSVHLSSLVISHSLAASADPKENIKIPRLEEVIQCANRQGSRGMSKLDK